MATTVADMADESSSSDDEALRMCQEAVWDCQEIKTKDSENNKKPSKRLVVADHEHDGNELQVTPGFQKHVATRLGAMLDSLISEKQSFVQPTVNTILPEDEGFRLFSTSVPGVEPVEPPPPKRPLPSSSDSDSEMESRFKEAAVSISDILSSSATVLPTIPAVPDTTSSETPVKVKKEKNKMKRKKLIPEENGHVLDNHNQSNIINQEEKTVKDKKKKKVTPADSAQNGDKHEDPPVPKSAIPISSGHSHNESPVILQSATALPNNPAETRSSDTQDKVKKKKKKKRKPYPEENGQQDSHHTTAKDKHNVVNQDGDQTAKHKKKKKKPSSEDSEVFS